MRRGRPRKRSLPQRARPATWCTTACHAPLDYDVRWQPNEYEPDGFVERIRPLELINGTHAPADCPQCGAPVLDNRAALICACGQAVALI